MNAISASKARNNLYKILNEVKNGLKSYTITLRSEAQAVVINPEELEALEETLDVLSDNKLIAKMLKSQYIDENIFSRAISFYLYFQIFEGSC
jgi:prevent-host-death family protein